MLNLLPVWKAGSFSMAVYKTLKAFNVLHLYKGFQNGPKNVCSICACKVMGYWFHRACWGLKRVVTFERLFQSLSMGQIL